MTDAAEARFERAPEVMQVHRQTVEHPFGTLKAWMGRTPLLCKSLPRVRTEMSLSVLAYNIRRLMSCVRGGGVDRGNPGGLRTATFMLKAPPELR